jgi:hypothetical protein
VKITLAEDQQQMLMDWSAENTAAEVEAECEPSGYRLEIHVSPYGVRAEAIFGARRLELGEVQLELLALPPRAPDDLSIEGDDVRARLSAMARDGK